jgi:acyl-CoA synthetase (NDP forming)
MLRTMKSAVTSLLLLIIGCQKSAPADPLSPEFKKSGKFAYSLLQQADQGSPVSSSDISRALAEAQASAANSDEKMAASMLGSYRSNLEYESMKINSEQLTSALAEVKQTRCELDKMFNEGFRGVEAMKACGEKLGA